MSMARYVSLAPEWCKSEWRRASQRLRDRGALVRQGRRWVCQSPPDDFSVARLKSRADQMSDLNELARSLARVIHGYTEMLRLDPGREWFSITNEQMLEMWTGVVVPLDRWRRESGDQRMNGGGLARNLRSLMESRGFEFQAKPALRVVDE
jgi:hypothetical protein